MRDPYARQKTRQRQHTIAILHYNFKPTVWSNEARDYVDTEEPGPQIRYRCPKCGKTAALRMVRNHVFKHTLDDIARKSLSKIAGYGGKNSS
jgi:hypothetical protein